jgi:hypothetical protein
MASAYKYVMWLILLKAHTVKNTSAQVAARLARNGLHQVRSVTCARVPHHDPHARGLCPGPGTSSSAVPRFMPSWLQKLPRLNKFPSKCRSRGHYLRRASFGSSSWGHHLPCPAHRPQTVCVLQDECHQLPPYRVCVILIKHGTSKHICMPAHAKIYIVCVA